MTVFLIVFGVIAVMCFILIGATPKLYEKYKDSPKLHKFQDLYAKFEPSKGQKEFIVVVVLIGVVIWYWMNGYSADTQP